MRFYAVVLSSLMCVMVACSSAKNDPPSPAPVPTPTEQPPNTPIDTPPTDTPPTNNDSDASVPTLDAAPRAPTNQAECITACEAAHPTSAALSHKLDATCYLAGVCEPVCNNVPPGKNFPPTNDADAAAPVACPGQFAEGVDPIMTPSAECSTCLANTPDCCKLWVDIFGSADGRALNKCAVKCFTDFKN